MVSAGQAVAPLPPQNLDAEESVLGAMMLSESAIEAASTALDAGDFYRESHARIYRAALELYQQGQPVDAITVADKLDERGELAEIGGKERIHELAALVPATSNAGHYAKIVREMATLRGLTAVGEQIQRLGWERPGETPELVDRAEQMVFDLAQHRIRGSFEHVETLVRETFEQITKMYESGGEMTGTPTGFRDVDHMTSGLQPGNLVIIAGRPSMGKSAFALGIASNLALHHGTPVGVFTLEMSKLEVAQRFMCAEARVELQRLRSGRLSNEDWPRLVKACDSLTKAPIFVDDTRLTTMLEIRAKARRLKAREPKLGAIIVDYLQLMSTGTLVENRVQEIAQISRALKVIAGDLEIPVIALSQLNRGVESRTDKRPLLSDLRDSGAVEQDADLVMFLYRDEYYNENSEDQGLAEVILAKHRNGPVGTEKLAFLKRFAKFSDLAPQRDQRAAA
jgi:replicative DNA helicase